jgi:ureidoglycolate dehydrogenase (NAD+)
MMHVSYEQLRQWSVDVLTRCNVRPDVAGHVTYVVMQASLRGVESHGIRLLPHYVAGVRGGRLNPDPKYVFEQTALSTGCLHADHTFGHAACMEAATHAIAMAQQAGTGFVAVSNSSHFGAAAPYALHIAKQDMIGLSFTNTDALVKSHGGTRAFFGNNPMCVTVPVAGEEPICLDMATSMVTFNKVRQLRESGEEAPAGSGADVHGVETTNAQEIVSLLPAGSYKGYGLSMIIEILCSVLTGMLYGPHIPKMFEAPMSTHRQLGQFIGAIRIDGFSEPKDFKRRLAVMIDEVRREPRANADVPIQVPGDPEKSVAAERWCR